MIVSPVKKRGISIVFRYFQCHHIRISDVMGRTLYYHVVYVYMLSFRFDVGHNSSLRVFELKSLDLLPDLTA